jgi:hypothetical protein
MSILSKRLSKIESELLVVVQPVKFMFITTCGHNDSDILGYKSGWGSLEVMRLHNESIEDLKERTQKIFIESETRNTSIFILRCIYENKPMARP